MRIIAGTYGGRRLEAPKGSDIRPTSDKLRGSIFNALSSRFDIEGAVAMDIFCGSGALGLEAISRGAGECLFVDLAKTSLDLAKRNAQGLGCTNACSFLLKDAAKLPPRDAAQSASNLFFCDPPYNKNFVPPAVESLLSGGWLAPGAFGVLETEKQSALEMPNAFETLSEKIYGDTKILLVQLQP
ncbi:MAG TPA: 16S rRNA (guanine(966)-N(2))-methyltransferase RsmD [Alphaproteobacteria bacterium]|nr:16S rRNA (guanine(966)-N(2))-methyltransferase RsmD [Alphaproteobacteria bacterium]